MLGGPDIRRRYSKVHDDDRANAAMATPGRQRAKRRQSPAIAWNTARAASAAVSARNTRGPSPTRVTKGSFGQGVKLAFGKAALRSDQQRRRPARAAAWPSASAIGGAAAGLVADDQAAASASQPASSSSSALGRANLGHRQPLALLRRLDGMGGEALAVEPLRLGALGHHRDRARGPELGRLLDQPVEPRALDRREQQPQIGFRLGRAQPRLHCERAVASGRARRSGTETRRRAR